MTEVTRVAPGLLFTLVLAGSGCFAEAPRNPPGPQDEEDMTARNGGPSVRITYPGNGESVANPVSFAIDTDPGIHRVELDADGWVLDDWDPHHYSIVDYTFQGVNTPRVITLTGFDAHGNPTDTDRVVITVYNSGNGYLGDVDVRIDAPGDGATVHNPVNFEVAANGVYALKLFADGYEISDFWKPEWGLSHTYTFSEGGNREIELVGYNSGWNRVAADTIGVVVDGGGDDNNGNNDNGNNNNGGNYNGALNVPYFYQYNNAYEPSATCGLTSAAMLLSYLEGYSIDPDTLYQSYGKAQGQSPGGLQQLYGWEGLYGASTYGGTRSMIKNQIDAGRPVLVHTYLTGAGHIVCIVGYDGSGWIVNDPAGDYYLCYGCNSTAGDHVQYPFGGSADNALSYDGDIWMSTADTSSFSL